MTLVLALATALASLAIVAGVLALHGRIVAERLGAAGPAVTGFTIAVFLLLLGVQTFRTEAVETFPLASWTMYGHPEPLTASWRFDAERASGVHDHLEPRLLAREPNPRIVGFWIIRWGYEMITGDAASVRDAEGQLERLARAFVALDALRNPDDPVTVVHLLHCSLPGAAGRVTAWRFECERARSWEVGE
jgi:hypothetical protein